EKLGLFILNNETPTYKRCKNILDSIICSKNMLEKIEKFDFLSHSISDHCPIAAPFINITTDPKYFENINWQKFRETLRSKPDEKNSHLNAKDLDMAVQSITNEIQEALKTATNRFQIKNVKNNVLTIPQHILKLIKFKRKENLKYLKNFRQSESKYWKALLNNNREENPGQKDINIKADHHFTNDPAEISELFPCNLEKIFTENHPTTRNNSLLVTNLNKIHISRKEMIKSIKTTNSRASAGLDLTSNKVSKIIPPDVKIALFADDLCIWVSKASKKDIQKILQNAVDKIIEYCKKWGFKINENKTCYTTFTKAGHRKNYEKTYGMKIKIGNSQIPIEPNPTFLGIKLDPKIDYKEHLKIINSKQISKINLIRKVKSFKWGSSIKINRMLYMSLKRSLFDYCFIILHSGTQKIKSEIQKMQNWILKIIKYFLLKTSIKTIHKELTNDL
ncbi:RNA-directed DNA polymerase from mobile element jockey-like, partial [Brachionus plicatilis]